MNKFDPGQDLLKILQKYLDGTATAEESRFVEAYYDNFEQNPDILDQYSKDDCGILENEMESYILKEIKKSESIIPIWRKSWFRTAVAASLFTLIAFGLVNHFSVKKSETIVQNATPKDFMPGGDKAILTLSDGSSIMLDNAAKGDIENGDLADINKSEEGELVYRYSEKEHAQPKTNTVSTPAGGKYRIVLADGSKVWLNAGSSLEFPTHFSGKERRVKVTGECYFEIMKDKTKPFIVNVADKQHIVVMGTHFNINSYKDEPEIKTTLLEGSVQVRSASNLSGIMDFPSVMLSPGEQSGWSGKGPLVVKHVDIQEVVAWKNGLFQFHNTHLDMVMRQIARWYNVEVTYEKSIPVKTFSGKIDRSANASQIMEILRFAGVNLRIEESEIKGMNGRIVVTQ